MARNRGGKEKYFVDPRQPSSITMGGTKSSHSTEVSLPGEEIWLTQKEYDALKKKGYHRVLLKELPEPEPLTMAEMDAEAEAAEGLETDTTDTDDVGDVGGD